MEIVGWMIVGWLAIVAIKTIDRALRKAQRRKRMLAEYMRNDPRFQPKWMKEANQLNGGPNA